MPGKEDAVDAQEAVASESQSSETVNAVVDESNSIIVYVNGEPVPMSGKKDYIFVDIFDRITFDLAAGGGRAIATLINGQDAAFSEMLHDGDQIDLYWKEN